MNKLRLGTRRCIENLTNKQFGRLRVIEYSHSKRKRKIRGKPRGYYNYWLCMCDCGNQTIVEHSSLRFDTTKSCGCLQKDRTIETSTKHGLARRNIYNPLYEKLRRQCPYHRLRKNISWHVWNSLSKTNSLKEGSVLDHLPFSIQQLKSHLEQQFTEDMTWDNYGSHWHLDHIIPQSHFYFTSLLDEDFCRCWALSNLQPLKSEENLKKGNRIKP